MRNQVLLPLGSYVSEQGCFHTTSQEVYRNHARGNIFKWTQAETVNCAQAWHVCVHTLGSVVLGSGPLAENFYFQMGVSQHDAKIK